MKKELRDLKKEKR